ncbi:pilus assembly protein [Azospirillum sp. B510]|uniref:type II and III secretion system protein family protein n=1 Tax=Azospirillum sp. (strain B510) TaxID=137722 RepID=UPI0001C4B98A|nr:type II and III secretion system protein family protein [Azospirillum sp. B510]BAI70766.1 pilus assembly protein [Azospirillum sp. B510]
MTASHFTVPARKMQECFPVPMFRTPPLPAARIAAALLWLAVALALSGPVRAAGTGTGETGATAGTMTLDVGTSEMVRLSAPATNVYVADPEIADVQAASGTVIFVLGRKPGRTTVYALTEGDRVVLHRDIRVIHSLAPLREQITARFPGMPVTVTSAPNRLIVTGEVPTPAIAESVMELVNGFARPDDKVVNQMAVTGPVQVTLRVQVAEVARSVTQELGFNWEGAVKIGDFAIAPGFGRDFLNATSGAIQRSATGASSLAGILKSSNGKANIAGIVDAMQDQGLVTLLAQPNLVAMSGKPAMFLAGGEFPIPVSAGDSGSNKIQVEFKQYGVALNFVPTVLAPDRIALTVRPEVSELTDVGAVTVNGLTIPALTVRRVETSVELGSGESFAIGGLLQNSNRSSLKKFPGLGDLPVLGELFRSRRFINNETELVVIVTPYVVNPIQRGPGVIPQRGTKPNREVEELLRRRQQALGLPEPAGSYYGPAGFIY